MAAPPHSEALVTDQRYRPLSSYYQDRPTDGFLRRLRDWIGDHKVISGIVGGVIAYTPIGWLTGVYPQIGPVPRTVASDSGWSWEGSGTVRLRQFEGDIWADASVVSHKTETTCRLVTRTTTVNNTTRTTTQNECTTKTLPIYMELEGVEMLDAQGNVLASDGGSTAYSYAIGAQTQRIPCPPAGEQITVRSRFAAGLTAALIAGPITVHDAYISDGECHGTKGLRITRYDGPEREVPSRGGGGSFGPEL